MSQIVDDILDRIRSLPAAERAELVQRFVEFEDAAWSREVTEARAAARQRGLTQDQIDRAVEQVRHGE